MELPEGLEAAVRTLAGAVDLLEAAAERRIAADTARGDLDTELRLMAEDRARLAGELDSSLAHAETLAAANADVSHRLDRVSATLQAMLTAPAPASGPPDAYR